MKHNSGPRALALAGLAVSALLTGCASSGSMSSGPVMGGQAGYHFSPLRCSVPVSLPGTTVTVVLADMGMTGMMGGDAPMGAQMMLHATPGVVATGKVSLVAENRGWRTHELVVLPLGQTAASGQRVPGADGKAAESGSLGEASASCAGGQVRASTPPRSAG